MDIFSSVTHTQKKETLVRKAILNDGEISKHCFLGMEVMLLLFGCQTTGVNLTSEWLAGRTARAASRACCRLPNLAKLANFWMASPRCRACPRRSNYQRDLVTSRAAFRLLAPSFRAITILEASPTINKLIGYYEHMLKKRK